MSASEVQPVDDDDDDDAAPSAGSVSVISGRAGAPLELPVAAKKNKASLLTDVGKIPAAFVADCIALVAAAAITSQKVLFSLLMAVLVLGLNATARHYRLRLSTSLLDELPSLFARVLVAGALVAATMSAVVDSQAVENSIHFAGVFLSLTCLGRAAAYRLIRRSRVAGSTQRPTIIVGYGRVGDQLAHTLLDHPEYGLTPVGIVDDSPFIAQPDQRVPLLGGTASLARTLVELNVRNVIVAFSSNRESVMVEILRTCDRLDCEIFVVPRLYELHVSDTDTELVWGIPVTRLRRAAFRTWNWRLKRLIDAVLAATLLVVFAPLMIACAFAVRVEGGPGVIFRQERVGLDGRPFTLLKFRSYRPDSEFESMSRWTIDEDSLGLVGRWLRRTSMDELPQLWNVVRGDMSLVGPRPERPYFVSQYTQRFPWYMARHRVPAGVTGWAQVNGLRGDTNISDRALFDNYYIENWSLWLDLKIILRTIAQVLGARG